MKFIVKKIKKVGDCHVWLGCINSDGYPKIGRKVAEGKYDFNIKGHRYVYEHTKGKIPDGHVVRHTCDNILCLNPEHLLTGTPADNMVDRRERGRTHCHVDELEIQKVKELYELNTTMTRIGKELGIKTKRVEYILNKYIR